MAPLPPTHDRLTSPLSAILPNIHKRSPSSCADYDNACNNTHRLIILIIILIVGFVVGLIFAFVCFRSRKRRIVRERQARAAKEQTNLWKSKEQVQRGDWEASPPYMPQRPESALRGWR
ncbi:hypothetical protein IAQ61_009473 [Plenodomus lingam]|uniref:Predicted protein n=1 Tax=Leptosphaeria maculans (strain JN3 / isolate v23.1.3 / race Av1-4-5-6-7-8) TaxID=985895 RepID=E4ZTF8_LEPMJ|nr:predicted protein [Plenodomus lingam JN3]KAH9863196.1 hypothetical protein IAQ61_009473 [Plenodomus lingam]CBX94814.1 predicted protein [Plenodomus lingam JN3]